MRAVHAGSLRAILLCVLTAYGASLGVTCAWSADAPSAEAPTRHPLSPDDLERVQDVSDPQVSPDGRWVAYVLTTSDHESDQARSAIWMVSWDAKERLALTAPAEGIERPRWSPDGRYLAFLSPVAGSDKTQIMVLDRRGGDARPLPISGDVIRYAWSPEGARLAIIMVPSEPPPDKNPRPIVIDALHFKDDQDGYLGKNSGRHLYVYDLAKDHADELTSDSAFNEDLPTWSPDGKQIAFIRTHEKGPDPDGRIDVDLIEARTGAPPRTLVRPYAPNTQKLQFSPDGKLLAYLEGLEPKFNAYMQDRLAVVPAQGGAARVLTSKLDRAVMSYAFRAPSIITVTVEDDRTEYAADVDIETNSITRRGRGNNVVSAVSVGGEHTAVLESDDTALAEVYALEEDGLRRLTGHNDALLAERELGSVEDVQFTSRDGADIHGLLVKPASFVIGRKYPTLLWIHGGPNGQDEHSLVLDGYEFEPQLFAAKGFVVLRVNYRGGSGRGSAFAKVIAADWGHKEVEDLLAGVDYLVGRGIADKQRLVIGGWSYGAILTDYTIASDTRFKAAISGAGSGNQLSTYGADEYVLQYNNELGPPWKNSALWLKVSYPFFHADRIQTPTLFMGGTKDFNVPIIGSEQMYQALRTLGIPARLIVYPDEHHVFTRPSFVKDLAVQMSSWVNRYVPVP